MVAKVYRSLKAFFENINIYFWISIKFFSEIQSYYKCFYVEITKTSSFSFKKQFLTSVSNNH